MLETPHPQRLRVTCTATWVGRIFPGGLDTVQRGRGQAGRCQEDTLPQRRVASPALGCGVGPGDRVWLSRRHLAAEVNGSQGVPIAVLQARSPVAEVDPGASRAL